MTLTIPVDGSSPQWELLHLHLSGTSGAVGGADGFLIVARGPSMAPRDISGTRWPSSSGMCLLVPGLVLVGFPRGVPRNETAETLRVRAQATFIAEAAAAGDGDRSRFRVHLPPLTEPFPVLEGRAYQMSVPSSRVLTLPVCQ